MVYTKNYLDIPWGHFVLLPFLSYMKEKWFMDVCVYAFYSLVIWDQIIYSSRDYLDAIQKFDALSF